MNLVHGGNGFNDDVTLSPDHVLDQGVHDHMLLVHEVLSVNGDVTFAPDHVLDQEVHDPIHLVHEVLSVNGDVNFCLLYTSPSPRDATLSRMPSSA